MQTHKQFATIIGVASIAALIVAPVITSAATTTINATIDSSITVSSTGTVAIALTPTAGGSVSSASDSVKVSTNSTAGYSLTLQDGDATTALTSGANTIAAHSGTFASPTALTGNSWGYAVAGGSFDASYTAEGSNASSTSKWAGITSAPQELKNTSSTAVDDETVVWYGVRATSAQPNGTYTDSVTYTATAKS